MHIVLILFIIVGVIVGWSLHFYILALSTDVSHIDFCFFCFFFLQEMIEIQYLCYN